MKIFKNISNKKHTEHTTTIYEQFYKIFLNRKYKKKQILTKSDYSNNRKVYM